MNENEMVVVIIISNLVYYKMEKIVLLIDTSFLSNIVHASPILRNKRNLKTYWKYFFNY